VNRESVFSDDSPDGIECRTLCSVETVSRSNSPSKRDWIILNPEGGLVKRFDEPWPPLENTDKGRDKFMLNAFRALRPEQEIIPEWADVNPGYSSSVSAALGNTKIRFGMSEICGCTMLFVVSHSRVYLGKIP